MDLQIDWVDTDSVDDNLIIAACPTTMLPLIWDRVVPLLERPLALTDEATLESVHQKLLSGEYLLVTISRGTKIIAVNTLEVREFESGIRALYIPLTGGDEMEEWLFRFLDIAKAIAKDLNCTQLRGIAVRKGWIRKLKPMGWSEVSTVIKCDIGD